jgi:hypothetical protein
MTYLEAIQASISQVHGVALVENVLLKVLIDQDINPHADYKKGADFNGALLSLYRLLLSGANLNEGAISYSLNTEGLKMAIKELEDSLGITLKPTINRGNVW